MARSRATSGSTRARILHAPAVSVCHTPRGPRTPTTAQPVVCSRAFVQPCATRTRHHVRRPAADTIRVATVRPPRPARTQDGRTANRTDHPHSRRTTRTRPARIRVAVGMATGCGDSANPTSPTPVVVPPPRQGQPNARQNDRGADRAPARDDPPFARPPSARRSSPHAHQLADRPACSHARTTARRQDAHPPVDQRCLTVNRAPLTESARLRHRVRFVHLFQLCNIRRRRSHPDLQTAAAHQEAAIHRDYSQSCSRR